MLELATGKLFQELKGKPKHISPDGKLLLGFDDMILTLIDTSTGAELRHLRAPSNVSFAAFAPGGAQVAAACHDGHIYIWDTATGTRLGRLAGHPGGAETVAFSPDGRQLVSFGADSSVLLWDIRPITQHSAPSPQPLSPAAGERGRGEGALSTRHSKSSSPHHPTPSRPPLAVKDSAEFDEPLPKNCYARLGSLQFQHEGWVSGLRFLSDGKTLLSCSDFSPHNCLCLWDADTGRRRHVLDLNLRSSFFFFLHDGEVLFVPERYCISPDGRLLAQATERPSEGAPRLCVKEVTTGKTLFEVKDEGVKFTSVQFAPDGTFLAALCDGGAGIHLYAVPGGAELRRLATPVDDLGFVPAWITFAPDGQHLAVRGQDRNRSALCIIDVSGFGPPVRLAEEPPFVNPVAFAPDGKALAVVSQPCVGARSCLRLWDVATGKLLRTLGEHELACHGLVFSADGKLLASHSLCAIRLWDVASGKELPTIELEDKTRTILFAPDGRTLAVGEHHAICLYDPRSARLLHELKADPGTDFHVGWHRQQAYCQAQQGFGQPTAFSPDGTALAAVQDKTVRRWAVASGQEIDPPANRTPVSVLAVSADGSRVAAGSEGHVLLWDAAGKPLHTFRLDMPAGVNCVALSPDGRLVAAGFHDGQVTLWNGDGKKLWQQRSHTDKVATLAFIDDGQTIVSAGADRQVVWRETATGQRQRQVTARAGGVNGDTLLAPNGQSPSPQPLSPAAGERGRGEGVSKVPPFSYVEAKSNPFEGTLALAGGRLLAVCDKETDLWDLTSSQRQRVLHIPDINRGGHASPVLSADGKLLALPQHDHIRLLDATTGKELRSLAGLSDIRTVALSSDGRLLAASGYDPPEVHIWDTATGTILARLTGHRGRISSVAFSGDGRTLATGGCDSTVLLWDVASLVSPPESPDPSAMDLANLWEQLASDDAGVAYQATLRLARTPDKAATLLRERLKPVAAPDESRLTQLIADLDSASFDKRQQAQQELASLDAVAEPSLRKALAGKPSAELRLQVEIMLKNLEGPIARPEQMRAVRAVELLERLGTPAARGLLEELAAGVPEARLTQEAKGALARMASGN